MTIIDKGANYNEYAFQVIGDLPLFSSISCIETGILLVKKAKLAPENMMTEQLKFLEHDTLDAQGLYCPEPVMLLHNKINDIPVGAILKVIATDPSTQRDIPKFCHFLNHELVKHCIQDNLFIYFIKKMDPDN